MSTRQRTLKTREDHSASQHSEASWKRKDAISPSGINNGAGSVNRKFMALALLLGILLLAYVAIASDLKPIHIGSKAIDSLAFSLNIQKAIHVAIIDAGSTGSRLLVYSFHSSIVTGNLVLDKEHFFEVKPGLSSFAKAPKDAASSLNKLLEKGKNVIPESEWQQTPLSMKATAGLRLIPENKANAILTECRNLLDSSGFRILKDSVSIMEGVDEGIFAWFTVNFLLDKFNEGYSPNKTVAALDLGGGSTQVTFVPDIQDVPKLQNHIHSIQAFNHNMSLFTYSYLKMGLMAARKEILTLSDGKRDKGNKIVVHSECINPIISTDWNYANQDYLVQGPINGGYKIIKAKNFSGRDEKRPIVRFQACEEIVKNYVTKLDPKPIGLNHHEIYAFSYYFDRAAEAALIDPFAGGVLTLDKLHKSTMNICDYPNTDQPFACLDLTYIYVLLKHGFGLEDSTKLFLYKKIDGHEVSWALGAAFNLLEQEF